MASDRAACGQHLVASLHLAKVSGFGWACGLACVTAAAAATVAAFCLLALKSL